MISGAPLITSRKASSAILRGAEGKSLSSSAGRRCTESCHLWTLLNGISATLGYAARILWYCLYSKARLKSPISDASAEKVMLETSETLASTTMRLQRMSTRASCLMDSELSASAGVRAWSLPREHHVFLLVILFWVSVPVLSEAITEQLPRVSTMSRRLTKTCFVWRARAVMESTVVTAGGRPCGTFARMTEMAVMITSVVFILRENPRMSRSTARTMERAVTILTKRMISISSRDFFSLVALASLATLPMRVLSPMLVTMPTAPPSTMSAPLQHMFVECTATSDEAFVVLLTGSDSPVIALLSDWRPSTSMRRTSPAHFSPARRMMRSPVTMSLALISTCLPSRMTVAFEARMELNVSMTLSVCLSSMYDMMQVTNTTKKSRAAM
eukprot:comp22286_c0_seq1/m.53246 comp22286_c0_seq1/g.53246  ORF comp22286_c0_seq1/g.53246 comp22286_c0_seq1/m.53246 type:complete len:387 (+) comp22286_c0_seq1:1662-2822(+)